MTEMKESIKGQAFNLSENVTYGIGSVVSKTLVNKPTGTVTLFSFDAGQGLSEHTAPFDAVVYILEGQAVITIGGSPHTVKSGEMIIMPANISHSVHAEERFKMLLILIRNK